MKAWEKAKELFPVLSRKDFIDNTCPHILKISNVPSYCTGVLTDPKKKQCVKCWDRELEEQKNCSSEI